MSFFQELKRRNVFKVGIAYVVAAWLTLQLADVLIDLLGLPEVVGKSIVLIIAVGFPLTLLAAWAFELTPQGVKRESDVQRGDSITPQTSRRLDRFIIHSRGTKSRAFPRGRTTDQSSAHRKPRGL